MDRRWGLRIILEDSIWTVILDLTRKSYSL